jgi:uracil-DNA glycosylase
VGTARGKQAVVDARRLWDALDERAVLVALGATAGQSLFGPAFRVTAARGSELALDRHRARSLVA